MINKKLKWSNNAKQKVKELHDELSINNKSWHSIKSIPEKRSSELIVSALSQLINNGKTEDIIALLDQSIKWLNQEIKDPGCPSH